MSLVLQMRSERAKLNDQLQALAKIEADGDSLTAEQLAEFGNLESQINALTDKISRAESAERAAASAAVPVNESARGITGPPEGRVEGPYGRPVPGASVAQMVRLLAATQGNQSEAAKLAKDGGYGADVQMALSTVTPGAGGVLVPENMATEVIESLRPRSIVRKMGVRSVPLNNGNLTMPRISGNTVVTYIGTETDIPITGMTFDDTKLSAKKAAAIVPVSNDLIRMSGVNPRVDQIVANDLTVSMGLSEDLHFIRSDGSGVLPKGLRYWAIPGNVLPAPVDPNLQQIDLFLGGMMLRVETAYIDMAGCGWLMHPRTLRWLQALRDGNGNKAYPEIDAGMLKGYPVGLSTQIPVNLGADGDESEIYFVNFTDAMIGEDMSLVINFSAEASYKDAQGNVVSAFQRDQTLVRVIAKHDFGPRHVELVVVATAVKWGAGM
ncbi:phage major capsid protein [Pseudomonas aeruginosa]|uniref:phage major capsid protein n=4 Tax=Pseudomonas aeruginosa TaxID=287 RepID=UPI0002EA5CE7|nr:phage major capsid protein [Pseudomonas aeruginosa]DAL36066.1 MAG TPA_asm: Major capsid protein [Caudoviricetes sp.]AOX28552.1 major capsid head protein [Pseudomonas aeruginosa]AOX41592.1 major capsid head protein [Pseudomonas aeruginosa]ARU34675.1 phage major capsid protein [Pseudomonas aeruginosa]EIU1420980.1 phage major capsid protein [Pseudomonas aeruginosa]